MKIRRLAVALGLAAVLLTLTAIVVSAGNANRPAASSWIGSGSTVQIVMNLSDEEATVVVDYYDQAGAVQATKSLTIPAYSGANVTEPGLPTGFNGSAVVSSDQPIAANAHIKWAGNTCAGSYIGFSSGEDEVYMPAVYRTNNYYSRVTVQNTGSGNATVYMNYTARDGSVTDVETAIVPAGAQSTWDLEDNTDLTIPWRGSLYITSTGDVAGIANRIDQTYCNAYNGFTGGSTEVYFPVLYRWKQGGNWLNASGFTVQNMSSVNTVTIYASLYYRYTGLISKTFTATIPALSAQAFNLRIGDYADLGEGWAGSAVVTGTEPIMAIANLYLSSNTESTAYNAASASEASTTLLVPQALRQNKGGGNWTTTGLQVQNVGANTADIYFYFYDRDGNLDMTVVHTGIEPLAQTLINLRNNTYATELGSNWLGMAVITSTESLIGIVNHRWYDRAGSYNMPAP